MKNKQMIEREVEETMNSLEGMQRAQPPAFLYTRLQARMEGGEVTQGFLGLPGKPVVSLVTLLLLLVLNIAAITAYIRAGKEPVAQQTAGIQSFAEEFNLSSSVVYNDKSIR